MTLSRPRQEPLNLELNSKFEAEYGETSFLSHNVCVHLPDGSSCEIRGNAFKLSGSLELQGRNIIFDGETLLSNDTIIASYNYSSGVMGVGQSFSLVDPNGQYMFALRPQGFFSANHFIISNRESTKTEIMRSFFGTKFSANASGDTLPVIVILCLWVAMVKMSN